jgi:hypothetical protein
LLLITGVDKLRPEISGRTQINVSDGISIEKKFN